MSLRVSYNTHEFEDIDIHLRTLRDNQQFEDNDGIAEKLGISSATWPLFGIVWPSAQVLAHYLYDFDFANKRILEVGCGIGLSSLLLNHLNADITATDYHPEVESFMLKNTQLNDDPKIPFVRTGWADEVTELGTFDLIVGSDLLYEDEHIEMLAGFIDQHCKAQCEIILVDPGRGRHAKFSKKMATLGFSFEMSKPREQTYLDKPFKGVVLKYSR
ncbi:MULTISPECIES: class I SAM-dependent methyltransferase [Corallincola]|uniref:Calmodulin-lysine N-methyltransferase n=2 Tax=Corallincola TaxID=1775176 RepID=A0ABY1WSU9_9GAMM|nr:MULTISPECIES: methyltransferase domain-containing protein [Corallincola]TAA47816.1 methyltransferase domain-containing protein [Corallincola spongiicola]TCI02041.1 methyltransferase domain-containing protein [Corallincola luteus]